LVKLAWRAAASKTRKASSADDRARLTDGAALAMDCGKALDRYLCTGSPNRSMRQ